MPADPQYIYSDADGLPVHGVDVVYDDEGGKSVYQHNFAGGAWSAGAAAEEDRQLFGRDLMAGRPGSEIWIVAGEKIATMLQAVVDDAELEVVVTTHSGGEGAGWIPATYVPQLIEHGPPSVAIIHDADGVGRSWAKQLQKDLWRIGAEINVVDLSRSDRDPAGAVGSGDDVEQWLEAYPDGAAKQLAEWAKSAGPALGFLELRQLVHDETIQLRFLIPGVLAEEDAIIVTGPDKAGKTKLARQLGVQGASGIHPFGGDDFEPFTVAHVDLEIGPGLSRIEASILYRLAGDRYQRGRHYLDPWRHRLHPVNDADGLREELELLEARLIIITPLYKAIDGSIRDDEVVKEFTDLIDELRGHTGAALTEGHWVKPQGGHQPKTPEGSAVLGHWTSLAVALGRDGQLEVTNGERMQQQRTGWPSALRRGDVDAGEWPWMPVTEPKQRRFTYLASLALDLDPTARTNKRSLAAAVQRDLLRRGMTEAKLLAEWGWEQKRKDGNPLGENAIYEVARTDEFTTAIGGGNG